ncbi:MAG: hemerythrin domain-containing protein [Nitrosospira sp.]
MPTTASTQSGKSTSRSITTRKTKNDAIRLLIDDHDKVKKMFKEYKRLAEKNDENGKAELATQICKELTVHAQLEEEIFYPAVREGIDDDDLMNEAMVEHAEAKGLIAQIQSMSASDPMYDATVTVLGENINHHIEEEQKEMFPKVQKLNMDLEELGFKMTERKATLIED